jgi:NADH-quinone oxidoreductase subunit A
MTALVVTLLVFIAIGATALAANLVVGWFVRPDKPTKEKHESYECGEEPIGPAWVQFDLRFYVVALLFIVFDVELAFLFPWAVAFGTANRLADPSVAADTKLALANQLAPGATAAPPTEAAAAFAQFAFFEMLVFFTILLLGFAYLWKRGDLAWVRGTAGQADHLPKGPHASAVG